MLICDGAFHYGRFHRDFNISSSLANKRYINWLDQMIDDENVYGLYWQNELAGFIAYQGNNLTLHAIGEDYRGKGFSKYWWGKVSSEILTDGNKTVRSSISATNLAALNLYASLGFSFENPKDVYHRVVP